MKRIGPCIPAFKSVVSGTGWQIIAVLVCFLCPLSVSQAQTQEYRIGVLTDELRPEMQPIVQQLQNEITSVVGNDAKMFFPAEFLLVNNFDTDLAARQYQRLLDEDIDIILAFGPANNEIISTQETYPTPTILFGAVNRDLLDPDENLDVSGIDNFSYVILSQSYEEDLQAFSTLFNFKNVGVVSTNPEIAENYSLSAGLDEIFANLGASHELINYSGMDQFAAQLEGVDSVYIAEGFSIPQGEIEEMARLLIRLGLPSFTNSRREDVEVGIMATNQTGQNLEQLFRRIALGVEAVVNGRNLANQPIYVQYNDVLTVNYNTAERVGVSLKYSQIATTDLVGNMDNIYADETYSLQEAIQLILERNLSLKSSQKDVELAELDVKSARTNYHPSISLNASSSYIDPDKASISGGQAPERSTNADITLSQTLYSQQASAGISIQKSLLEAQRQDFNATELDLILNAASASIDLLSLKKLLEIEQRNLDVTRRNLKVAQQNFDAGQSSKSDVFRFQSQAASNMQGLIEALANYVKGIHRLNTFFDNPIETRVDIRDIPIDDGPFEGFGYAELAAMLDDPRQRLILENFLVEEAFTNAPELKSLAYNIDATEKDKAQYGWRRFLPTVTANASYNELIDQSGVGVPADGQFVEDDYSVGLRFSIPLYNQNTENVARSSAETQRQKLLLSRALTAQSIETNVRDAVQEVTSKIAGIELNKVSEDAARQSLELTESAYSNGAATIADLIDAQNNYFQAQSASATAKYDFIKAALGLERQAGHFYFIFPSREKGIDFLKRLNVFRTNFQTRQ